MTEVVGWSVGKRVATATAVAGTLDILAAIVLTLAHAGHIGRMLRGVASGPFPAATEWGASGAVLGLAVHFVLMAVMVIVFVLAADRISAFKAQPLLWGVIYGLVTYVAMNWIVVPLRFHLPLPPTLPSMATQLFCHIILVGIPIAYIARR